MQAHGRRGGNSDGSWGSESSLSENAFLGTTLAPKPLAFEHCAHAVPGGNQPQLHRSHRQSVVALPVASLCVALLERMQGWLSTTWEALAVLVTGFLVYSESRILRAF